MRWLLTRRRPLSMNAISQHMGWWRRPIRKRCGFYQALGKLFRTVDVVIAYRLLFRDHRVPPGG